MASEELKTQLDHMSALRNSRQKVANEVNSNPELFETLLYLVFDVENTTSVKAAWVFELVCDHNLDALAPHLDFFTLQLKDVRNDSAVRPLSKICEMIAKAYYSKKPTIIKEALNDPQIETIIESCFDWLIGGYKVAAKAYAMSALYLFGKDSDWIHEELLLILIKDIQKGSPAYCARGKKIIALINKNK